MDKLLQMSAKELTRLEVMRLTQKRMSQKEAGRLLSLSLRQIKRLLRAYRSGQEDSRFSLSAQGIQ